MRAEASKCFKGSVGQQRVPEEFLEKLIFPLPPLDEQKRIVKYLDGIQGRAVALEKKQQETESEIDKLKESILNKAFMGKLIN